ncbi:hypothetical protein [Micromonospora auratinigra]|uniref:Uncharacterized protein n=1 Tax=Micromonospora auratinigra TaxID=261654 RepID=A0A1A8ZGY7_9ACTN|nr:hypothetical protein [Micromonospora auratinigra]SBT43294.1 hypothetical protein GA0070611_2271 [Micromonospora auratinigra]
MTTSGDLPTLTPHQLNVLVVLMVEARELTNTELRELAGAALTGPDNAKLVTLGLVETDRSHRPFTHQLTDAGWRVTRQLHTGAPPARSGSATRSLLTVLANLHRGLDRLRVSHGDFFSRTAEPAVAEPAAAPGQVAERIRAAYRELAPASGAWVGLADVREHLGELERGVVDAALRALVHQDGVRIIPVANTKSLTARDRAAAVRIGDEDNHALAIGPA